MPCDSRNISTLRVMRNMDLQVCVPSGHFVRCCRFSRFQTCWPTDYKSMFQLAPCEAFEKIDHPLGKVAEIRQQIRAETLECDLW